MNCGSVESFHVSTRCGFNPKARHIRDTVDCDNPLAFAIDRDDQCVSPFDGACSNVFVIASWTLLSDTVRGSRPRGRQSPLTEKRAPLPGGRQVRSGCRRGDESAGSRGSTS
ncbi:hypothetical protein UG55_108151 [Frankia sp. EI5c]|nr:hypothetical protein UG55_108151 [Frankia sp. EI5c]